MEADEWRGIVKQKIVGIYYAGFEQFELVLREGDGAEFYAVPEHGENKIPRIKIGADQGKWDDVIAVLLHEVQELIIFRLRGRYSPSDGISIDHAAYLFILTHPEFSELCKRTAEFISDALPDLAKAWKEWKKNK